MKALTELWYAGDSNIYGGPVDGRGRELLRLNFAGTVGSAARALLRPHSDWGLLQPGCLQFWPMLWC